MSDFNFSEALQQARNARKMAKTSEVCADDWQLPPYTVEHVFVAHAQVVDWGVKALNIPTLWADAAGENVTVAVLDTGNPDHPDLQGVVQLAKDFTGSQNGVRDLQGHGCIAPGDQVYTSLCGLQKIETLFDNASGIAHFMEDGAIIKDVSRRNIHTLSLTPEGKTERRRVMAVHKLKYKGPVYKVEVGNTTLTFTPWHPVYVVSSSRGNDNTYCRKRADELAEGDYIALSGVSNGVTDDYLQIPLPTYCECRFCGRRASAWKRKQCRGCNKHRWASEPKNDIIPLDEDLAFFAGLVASDGHMMLRQTTISFSNNDQRQIDSFNDLCLKLFDKGTTQRPQNNGSSVETRLHHNKAFRVLEHVGIPRGNKSRTIEFPELIAKSPRRVILAFFAGLLEVDGCVRDNRLRLTTGSKKFAEKASMLLRTLGIRSFVSIVRPTKGGFSGIDGEPNYSVRISPHTDLLAMLRVKSMGTDAPWKPRAKESIKSIEVKKYSGHMYDLTVEDSHNYVANGCIVSNTHCCGIIAARDNALGVVGVAPKANLVIGKVLGDSGSGSSQSVAAGVKWAADQGVDIISMSLGSSQPDSSIKSAIQYAVGKGVYVVCAAGNDGPGPNTVDYPGRWPEVIAVASTNQAGQVSNYSSRGPEVDIAAPGEQIVSTYLNGTLAKLSGTCLAKGSYVYGPSGPMRIEDVQAGDVVFAYKNGDIVQRPVQANHYRGRSEVHQLRAAGRDILVTATHQMLVLNQKSREVDWISVGSLKEHHRLLLPREMPTQVNPYLDSTLSKDFCFMLGFFAGDGWLSNTTRGRRVNFASGDNEEIINRVTTIYQKQFGKQMSQDKNGKWHYDDSTRAAMIVEALGLNAPAKEKSIPLWIWNLSREKQLAFYNGYRTADGHVYKHPEYRSLPDAFECSSGDLVRRLAALADYHGWEHSTVSSRTRTIKVPSTGRIGEFTSHSLRIIRKEPMGGWNSLRSSRNGKIAKGEKIAFEMGLNVKDLFCSNWRIDECKGTQDVYDLTVPDADCFVTQGLVTHNSMATPFVAGVIALALSKYKKIGRDDPNNPVRPTPAQMAERLRQCTTDMDVPGFDWNAGWGLIDPSKLVGGFQPVPPVVPPPPIVPPPPVVTLGVLSVVGKDLQVTYNGTRII